MKPSADDLLDEANEMIRKAYELQMQAFSRPMPVGRVQWVPADEVEANDYNPNSVAKQEMSLLHTSIEQDGYTQPVVVVRDEDRGKYVVVDGFHRTLSVKMFEDIREATCGRIPVVVIEKSMADRMASTVRHNRARGKHSVEGMGNLVFQMLEEGEDDVTICNKLGLEAEELRRLKHITGFAALYKNAGPYSTVALTENQMKFKGEYARSHPEEKVEKF